MVDRYDLPLPAWAFRSFTVVMLVFLVAPALIVVPVSFSSGSIIAFPFPGYTSRWYAEVVTAPAWQAGVENSLIIGCAAAVLSTVIGTQGALGINRLAPRSRLAILVLVLFPLMVPIVITALGGYLAMVKIGLNNTYWAAIFLHAMLGMPFVVISVLSALQGFDNNLWRAAASLRTRNELAAANNMKPPMVSPNVIAAIHRGSTEKMIAVLINISVAMIDQIHAGVSVTCADGTVDGDRYGRVAAMMTSRAGVEFVPYRYWSDSVMTINAATIWTVMNRSGL